MTETSDTTGVMKILANKRDLFWCVGLLAAASFYRPLVFWAENAWDLSAPQRLFATASIGMGVGFALLTLLVQLSKRPLPAAILVGGLLFLGFNWRVVALLSPVAWLGVLIVATVIAQFRVGDHALRRVAMVLLAVVFIAPAFQVALQHISHRVGYPLVPATPPATASATGLVEDVVVVIVDSYPMLAIAEDWFGNDPSNLVTEFGEHGFEVPDIAWSHNTFTGLAVPSILQLDQITDDSPKGEWGNRRASYDIVRGENFVAGTLRNAGFTYSHIEGGWDGAVCGPVDRCYPSHWLDEANWNMLRPSVIGPYLDTKFGSMEAVNTLNSVDSLSHLALIDNGEHDYVYIHLMLPHAPYVVDDSCQVVPPDERSQPGTEPIRRQLACVDSLLRDLIGDLGEHSAVLVTGDHGSGFGEPDGSSEGWSDAQVAERLGILLAHRMPSQCPPPVAPTSVYAMRAIMACAVDAELPSDPPKFLLGAEQPVEIESARLKRIGEELLMGSLQATEH